MSYPSDLNDVEWQRIQPLLPPAKSVGKQREVDLRSVLDAIFGCELKKCGVGSKVLPIPVVKGSVNYFVSGEIFGQSVLKLDSKAVERRFPISNRHRPLL
jgi:hypothetical protein